MGDGPTHHAETDEPLLHIRDLAAELVVSEVVVPAPPAVAVASSGVRLTRHSRWVKTGSPRRTEHAAPDLPGGCVGLEEPDACEHDVLDPGLPREVEVVDQVVLLPDRTAYDRSRVPTTNQFSSASTPSEVRSGRSRVRMRVKDGARVRIEVIRDCHVCAGSLL